MDPINIASAAQMFAPEMFKKATMTPAQEELAARGVCPNCGAALAHKHTSGDVTYGCCGKCKLIVGTDTREAPAPKPQPQHEAPSCVECGGPLQWRCPACRIAQSREVVEAPVMPRQRAVLYHPFDDIKSRADFEQFFRIVREEHASALTTAREAGRLEGREEMRLACIDKLTRLAWAASDAAVGCESGSITRAREDAKAEAYGDAISALPREGAPRSKV